MIQDLMTKVDTLIETKVPTQAYKAVEVKGFHAKISHLESFNILKRNKARAEEIKELKKDIEETYEC